MVAGMTSDLLGQSNCASSSSWYFAKESVLGALDGATGAACAAVLTAGAGTAGALVTGWVDMVGAAVTATGGSTGVGWCCGATQAAKVSTRMTGSPVVIAFKISL
jgi:hypothetical protein